ncbi:MAG: hypothetical protein AAF483_10210 [Planctomycetota bacterium]
MAKLVERASMIPSRAILNWLGQFLFASSFASLAALSEAQERSNLQSDSATKIEVASFPETTFEHSFEDAKLQIRLSVVDLRVQILNSSGQFDTLEGVRGIATLQIQGNPIHGDPKRYRFDLLPDGKGRVSARSDFTRLRDKQIQLAIELYGVEKTLRKKKFRFDKRLTITPSDARERVLATIASEQESTMLAATRQKAGESPKMEAGDELMISLQKTCPVTGKALGAMGKPPKVVVDGKPFFVCCAPCIQQLEAKKSEYLPKYYEAKGKEIRTGVFEATLADAEAILAQGKCPVMKKKLGGMGTPQKVKVKDKAVYICCLGCARRLRSDPDKYLAFIDQQGVTPPEFK